MSRSSEDTDWAAFNSFQAWSVTHSLLLILAYFKSQSLDVWYTYYLQLSKTQTALFFFSLSLSLNVNVQRSCSSALNARLRTRGTSGNAASCSKESDISVRRDEPDGSYFTPFTVLSAPTTVQLQKCYLVQGKNGYQSEGLCSCLTVIPTYVLCIFHVLFTWFLLNPLNVKLQLTSENDKLN